MKNPKKSNKNAQKGRENKESAIPKIITWKLWLSKKIYDAWILERFPGLYNQLRLFDEMNVFLKNTDVSQFSGIAGRCYPW